MAQQTYPLQLPFLKVTVNGTDRTDEVLANSLVVTQILGDQVDRCFFQLKAKEEYRGTAGSKPVSGQSIIIEIASSTTTATPAASAFARQFAGTILRVREILKAYKTVAWECECVDYTLDLQKVFVDERYNNARVSDIVRDVVQRYAPFVSSSGIQTTETIVDAVTYSRRYPADVVSELARVVGYEWWVDPQRVFHFVDPASGTQASSLTIDDTSANFDQLTIEPQLDQVRNRVIVEGHLAVSDQILTTWDNNGVARFYSLPYQNVVTPTTSGTAPDFMTIDGVPQTVGVFGSTDESIIESLGGWMLNMQKGEVYPTGTTDIPPDGTRTEFRYSYEVPVHIVREDLDSQETVAALEGTDYDTVVLADSPLHYWRLNDISGSAAVNAGSFGVAASGIYSGNVALNVMGPLTGNKGGIGVAFRGGRVQVASGTIPSGAYTLEAWVQTSPKKPNAGMTILGARSVGNIGADIIVDSTATDSDGGAISRYGLRHRAVLVNGGGGGPWAIPAGTRYDHVVATYDGSTLVQLFVNKQWVASGVVGSAAGTPAGTYLEIGSSQNGSLLIMDGRISRAAVYSTALAYDRIAAHYDSGRWAGVREALITDSFGTYDQARKIADNALVRWGTVITDLAWTSYVPGWRIGDTVTLNLTASGIGRTFSGSALIQDLTLRWEGAQRVRYSAHARATRFNFLDYLKRLTDQALYVKGTASPITYVRTYQTSAVLIGATISGALLTPPFYVQPQSWETGGASGPFIKVARFFVTSGFVG